MTFRVGTPSSDFPQSLEESRPESIPFLQNCSLTRWVTLTHCVSKYWHNPLKFFRWWREISYVKLIRQWILRLSYESQLQFPFCTHWHVITVNMLKHVQEVLNSWSKLRVQCTVELQSGLSVVSVRWKDVLFTSLSKRISRLVWLNI